MFDPSWLRLIAVMDSLRDGVDGLTSRARSAVDSGATMIHLRLVDASARTLADVTRLVGAALGDVPLLVSDRADVAMAAGALGVHVSLGEVMPASLRRVVPAGFV